MKQVSSLSPVWITGAGKPEYNRPAYAAAVGITGPAAANSYVENKEKLLLEFTHGGRCNSDSIEVLTVQIPPYRVAVPFDTEYMELVSQGSAAELS